MPIAGAAVAAAGLRAHPAAAPPRRPSRPCPAAICAVQNAAIIGLIFRLDDVPRRAALALSAALAGATWWLFGACPADALRLLQTGSVALLALGGRMPQARGV